MTTAATTAGAVERRSTPLRPAITRPMLTVFVFGDVLGAGIYAPAGEVADTTVLLLLGVFVCVNLAVLVLRREWVEHEHWHAPTLLPVLATAACLG
jgi:hypothetical protein